MKLVTKPLLNAVAVVVAAGSMTISAPALSASANASHLKALERLSEMKIRHAVLAESLQNIQIEAHIKAVEKKMNGSQGVSSASVPVVSLLTCSAGVGQVASSPSRRPQDPAASHCAATLSLPNGTRIPAYPGTVIGDGLKIVGVTEQGVLAADGSSRFYLPFSGGVTSPLQGAAPQAGFGAQGSTLPPPGLGGTSMNATTPPAGMLPSGGMPPAGLQPAGMQ